MSLVPILTDYKPKPKTSLNVRLDQSDIKYFDELVSTIIAYPNHVQYFGRPKRLYQNNYFTTIFNETTWFGKQKTKWELYVRQKFARKNIANDDPINNFNQWCYATQIEIYNSELKDLSFYDNPDFNLVFIRQKDSLNCYARMYPYNNQVKYIAKDTDNRFYDHIIRYLRFERHLKALISIKKNQTIIDTLTMELTRGFHIVNEKVKLIGNNPDTYCLYFFNPEIPDELNTGFRDWLTFMDQFETDNDKLLFMAWIYSIFVEDDRNRQILWVEGAGFSGKSSIVSVIGEILSDVNHNLYKVINPQDRDTFALAGIDNCRLLAFPDNKNKYLVQEPIIRNVTGDDPMSIREMNTNPRTGFVHCKVIVTSNHDTPPIIDYSKREDITRLLHLKLDQKKIIATEKKWSARRNNKSSFKERLKQQFPSFMRKAGMAYHKCKQNNGLLKVPK